MIGSYRYRAVDLLKGEAFRARIARLAYDAKKCNQRKRNRERELQLPPLYNSIVDLFGKSMVSLGGG